MKKMNLKNNLHKKNELDSMPTDTESQRQFLIFKLAIPAILASFVRLATETVNLIFISYS